MKANDELNLYPRDDFPQREILPKNLKNAFELKFN